MRPAKNHRPALLKTATRLFAQKPFHEVLMEDVAAETGVAKGTIYRFFPTKEKLYDAVCLESLDEMNGQLGVAAQTSESPLIRVERMTGIVVEYFSVHRDFFEVLQRKWVSAHRNRSIT
jgi:AcrR family transcriptional regulator